MRFSLLLALVIATFIACTSSASAKNAAIDHTVRSLKGSQLTAADEDRGSPNFALLDDTTKKLDAKQFVGRAAQNWKIGKIDRASDKMKAGAAEAAKLTKQQEEQIARMVARAAKNKVPWSKTKKIIVGVGGAAITAAAVYALYKMFVSNGGTATTTA